MKRALLLQNSPKEVYGAMFKWFSIQGYEITEQVHNKRLSVTIVRIAPFWYWTVGILLFALFILPSIPWFILARGSMTIDVEESPEGTYVVANLKGKKANDVFNYLIGILSMLPTITPKGKTSS